MLYLQVMIYLCLFNYDNSESPQKCMYANQRGAKLYIDIQVFLNGNILMSVSDYNTYTLL